MINHGGCLCGEVRIEAHGTPVVVAHCHCEHCQRSTGAGHSTGAMFPIGRFRLNGTVREFAIASEAETTVTRVFCPTCGSLLLSRNDAMPDYVTVPLGVMDDVASFKPEVVIFARNRKPWDAIDPTLPAFDGQPKWSPENSPERQ